MDLFDSEEDKINLSLMAYEVSMKTIESIIDYYSNMLVEAIVEISELTGISPINIRLKFEHQLGLVNAMDTYLNKLQVSSEFNRELFDISEEELEEILKRYNEGS